MRADFHCHILPGMDDGSKDVATSIAMLETLKADGVETVVLTPHFYKSRESVDGFLSRRKESFEILSRAVAGRNMPVLLLGAEVAYTSSLSDDDMSALCIQGTNLLLLELPFMHFSKAGYNAIGNFISGCGCDILFAHIERYFGLNRPDELLGFVAYYDALAHVGCSSFFEGGFFERKKLLSLAKKGAFPLMGSDAHDMTNRKPEFGRAEKYLRDNVSDAVVDSMFELSEKILCGRENGKSLDTAYNF